MNFFQDRFFALSYSLLSLSVIGLTIFSNSFLIFKVLICFLNLIILFLPFIYKGRKNKYKLLLERTNAYDIKFWILLDRNLNLLTYDGRMTSSYSVSNFIKLLKLRACNLKLKNKDITEQFINSIFEYEYIELIKIEDTLLVLSIDQDHFGISNNYRKIINHDLPSLFLSIKSKVNRISREDLEIDMDKEIWELGIISDRLNFLFRGIVQIYRSQEVKYEDSDFSKVMRDTLIYLNETYDLSYVKINNSIQGEIFNIDSNLLLIILYNLLKNSIDHNFEQDNLEILIKSKHDCPQGYIGFTIQDNGSGIQELTPKDILKEGVKSPNSKGLGYGLSLTYDIIKLYHGNMVIGNNNGFEVSILLPK